MAVKGRAGQRSSPDDADGALHLLVAVECAGRPGSATARHRVAFNGFWLAIKLPNPRGAGIDWKTPIRQ